MKYYIAYFDDKGYYSSYKNKGGKINLNVPIIYRKKSIKTTRRKKLYKLENLDNPDANFDFLDGDRIEMIEIEGNNITHLGQITNEEIYEFIKSQADKFIKKHKIIDHIPEKNATEEDIDDFCSHMDNKVLSK